MRWSWPSSYLTTSGFSMGEPKTPSGIALLMWTQSKTLMAVAQKRLREHSTLATQTGSTVKSYTATQNIRRLSVTQPAIYRSRSPARPAATDPITISRVNITARLRGYSRRCLKCDRRTYENKGGSHKGVAHLVIENACSSVNSAWTLVYDQEAISVTPGKI